MSHHYDHPVLSPSFFDLFDSLDDDASNLNVSSTSLQEIKEERNKTQTLLKGQQHELRRLRAFIKQQNDRIQLVSTHWFYGNTLFQPQLWFKGGCKGKISRARAKLTTAKDQDLPRTMNDIRECQEALPELYRVVEQRLLQYEVSANAASEREAMKQRAVFEFPSDDIRNLQRQQADLEQAIRSSKQECQHLDHIISQLVKGQELYQSAGQNLQDAQHHYETHAELVNNPITAPRPRQVLLQERHSSFTETFLNDGTKSIVLKVKRDPQKHWFQVDKYNNILSTNFPCPNGCGFLVTWHDTHCCNACARGSNGHGQRCQRKPIAKEAGAQGKLRKWQQQCKDYQISVTLHHKEMNAKFSQAKKETKEAERTGLQTLASIPFGIRQRFPALYNSLRIDNYVMAQGPHGGCGCSQLGSIQEELVMVATLQSSLEEQLRIMREQLLPRVKNEASELESKLNHTKLMERDETDRIFMDLRRQVLGHQTSVPAFNPSAAVQHRPSAPTEEQVLTRPLASPLAPTASAPTEEQIVMEDHDAIRASLVANYPLPIEAGALDTPQSSSVPMAQAVLLPDL